MNAAKPNGTNVDKKWTPSQSLSTPRYGIAELAMHDTKIMTPTASARTCDGKISVLYK